MIRVPATSISLSEDDIQNHLRRIGIYQSLLEQGFKKQDIIRYYEEQRRSGEGHTDDREYQIAGRVPSSVQLRTMNVLPEPPKQVTVEHQDYEREASPGISKPCTPDTFSSPQSSPLLNNANLPVRPRQTSLLRFTVNASPGTSEEVGVETSGFLTSPHTRRRTYRPRSHTYPYTESEAGIEEDLSRLELSPSPSTIRPSKMSPLRPNAEDFIPLRRSSLERTPHSPDVSYASSPPSPRTEPQQRRSLAVYNDGVPPERQPQTPADLSRGMLVTEHHAAYTALPGRITSQTPQVVEPEQSPTIRAMGMRERRHREFLRSVRMEAAVRPRTDLWRDELDADRVGEENFERQ